jgi:hypothetical protein
MNDDTTCKEARRIAEDNRARRKKAERRLEVQQQEADRLMRRAAASEARVAALEGALEGIAIGTTSPWVNAQCLRALAAAVPQPPRGSSQEPGRCECAPNEECITCEGPAVPQGDPPKSKVDVFRSAILKALEDFDGR